MIQTKVEELKDTEAKTGALLTSSKSVPDFENEMKAIQDAYAELHPEAALNVIRDKFKQ
jgi:hypothetical protein